VFNENVSWKVIKFNLYMKALNRKNYIFYQLTAHRSYPISWGKCFTFTDRSSRQWCLPWQEILINPHTNHVFKFLFTEYWTKYVW